MKKIFLLVFLLSIYTGCIKEYSTSYTAYLVNPTQHQITVLCYKEGVVSQDDSISIPPFTHIMFAQGSYEPPNPHPKFSTKYFGSPDDSLVVVFDHKFRISHYGNTPLDTATKYYLYSSLRNLRNMLSYEFYTRGIKGTKSINNTHVYRFIEQDYLDAK